MHCLQVTIGNRLLVDTSVQSQDGFRSVPDQDGNCTDVAVQAAGAECSQFCQSVQRHATVWQNATALQQVAA
jgi:hypothetical protein